VARAAQVGRARYLPLAGAAALLAGAIVCAHPGQARAQARQKAAEPPAKYDQYEPSRVRRGRGEVCGRNEEQVGAYCVKPCMKGYVLVPNSDPARCRGVEPLPAGQIPGPIRKETGAMEKPPPPRSGTKPPEGV
jgi:hypothetical protein